MDDRGGADRRFPKGAQVQLASSYNGSGRCCQKASGPLESGDGGLEARVVISRGVGEQRRDLG